MRPLREVYLLKITIYLVGILLMGYVGYVVYDTSSYVKQQELERTRSVEACSDTLRAPVEHLNTILASMPTSTNKTQVEAYVKLAPAEVRAPVLDASQYP